MARRVKLAFEVNNQPVSDHLTNEFWRLKKLANEKLDPCPVCLEDCFGCRKCTLLLVCGHCLCASCYIKLAEKTCPICRR